MLYRILLLFYFIALSKSIDYYELLGISRNAGNREIRKAFKKLALIYHPDKNKGKEDAHDKFLAISKAYEILKDEELRKNYDLYGEEGLKEDFKKSWKSNYYSWSYYHESFGIYDDDPEIVTLSYNDFERFVLDSEDVWFVNFYSPHCSHCHILAPSWRRVAQELKDVIQIGAVNCEEDWMLCRRQNVFSYPSLIFYTFATKTKYEGSREVEDMVEYVLKKLPDNVIWLTSINFESEIEHYDRLKQLPWLIAFCKMEKACVAKDDLKKLGIILDDLVHVAEVLGSDDDYTCQRLSCESPVTYFDNLTVITDIIKIDIEDTEVPEIVTTVLQLLPDFQEISYQDLQLIRNKSDSVLPWLIHFTNEEESSTEKNIHLKRLNSLLPEVNLGHFNCYTDNTTCTSLFIVNFPTFILFRRDGTYEFYYGRITAYDVASFAHEASISQVHTLVAGSFHDAVVSSEPWFIDFFAPWCPPCIQFLSIYRKVSAEYGDLVKFGTVDCSVHKTVCHANGIKSYPSAILYKDGVLHKYYGLHNENDLAEFIEDVLNPVVISLTPISFQEAISNKETDDIWVIDFFAPWCGPCQQLAPQWRKMAKMLKHFSYVHVGEIDCVLHSTFCSSSGIDSYPTIRLFPRGSISTKNFFTYSGWSRDAHSLQAWVYDFLPSKVTVLSDIDFQNVLKDSKPWVIDFFTPWCKHCQNFAPEFEKIAQRIEGRVKAGKINCDEFSKVCELASINAYPTVVFYKGKTGSKQQHPIGEVIHPFTIDDVISFLENNLSLKFKELPLRDEL